MDDTREPIQTENLLEEHQQSPIKRKRRKVAENNEEETVSVQTNEQKPKVKSEKLPSDDEDPLEHLPKLKKTSAERMRRFQTKQKSKDPEGFLQNERHRIKERRAAMTEEQKIELRKKERERKRRQRQKLLEDDDDIETFPLWIQQEIDELEKELNVRPKKIKLWQMTGEQLEAKRKYERENQRRQRAKIKAKRSIYDPLDLLQQKGANADYDDDDEGCVQHLWRPDVE